MRRVGKTCRAAAVLFVALAAAAALLYYLLPTTPVPGDHHPPPSVAELTTAVEPALWTDIAGEEGGSPSAADAPAAVVATEDHAPAPCRGCLGERAARDVAEAYLINIDPNYVREDGLIVELYIDDTQKPPLPPEWAATGLPFASNLAKLRVPDRDHTWVVWVQTGWFKRELLDNYVEMGELPLEALSWPLPKIHRYIFVNAKTGFVWPQGLFPEQLYDIDYGISRERAKRAAEERAEHWLSKVRPSPSSY